MTGKNTAVFGIYPNANQAEHTVDRLIASGFASDDISVLLPDNKSSKDFAHEKNTKAPEGTTTGVTAGGAIGGTLGLLAGIGALGDSGPWPIYRSWPHHGCARRPRSGRGSGRFDRRSRRNGHSRIRSEAIRRKDQRRWRSSLGSLRHFRGDHAREGPAQANWRSRHLFEWRS